MTVGKLIEKLNQLPDNVEVVYVDKEGDFVETREIDVIPYDKVDGKAKFYGANGSMGKVKGTVWLR